MMQRDIAISVDGLEKSYKSLHVLEKINFTVLLCFNRRWPDGYNYPYLIWPGHLWCI